MQLDNVRTVCVAAIGHRLIPPEVRARVAETVERVLSDIRAGAEGVSATLPVPAKLVLVSPLAQGADQLIAASALLLGYRLAAVLPAAEAEYERTFDLGTAKEDIATFRYLMTKTQPPIGEGCLVLDGDLSHADSRDRAFLSCADAVIRRADIVVAILSKDRWQSQSGQTVRHALVCDIPVIVIAPQTPDEAILYVQRGPELGASKQVIKEIVAGRIEQKFPDPIAKARDLLAAGDCLAAIDLLRNLSDDKAGDRLAERDYLLTLALARTGASRLALETFRSRLAAVDLDGLPVALARDIGALEARCLKDLALDSANREALLTAAQAYQSVYRRFGGYYPLINAATLTLLGGDHGRAQALARDTLAEATDSNYWSQVSRAEALLILKDVEKAATVLEAASASPVPPSDLATTKRQLSRICAANDMPASVLSSIRIPSVLYYRAGAAAGDDTSPPDPDIQSQIRTLNPGFAYGSLANTGDILIAEALLDMGVELNVVLPYRADEFARACIPPGWSARFDSCIRRATSLSFVLDNDVLHHECVLAMSARQAKGLAHYRADKLASAVVCLADQNDDNGATIDPAIVAVQEADATRSIVPRCLLFADVKGFSKLPERDMDAFVRRFMGAQAKAIGRFGFDIDYRATAGDGIFLVFRTPLLAAECGLAMQQAVGDFDRHLYGIGADLQLRIAIHYGPVHPVHDPILDRPSFAGREIIRAARMEPITPPGEIFVTEQLASALFLAGAADYRCDYVGILPSAKSFGSFRMYSIKSGV